MSLLPHGYLATTVAIESAQEGPDGVRYKTIGTGFFVALEYGDASPAGEPNYRLFLATNRHVLVDRDELLIRVNAKQGAARRVRLALREGVGGNWAAHPDEQVDVAAVLVNARALRDAGLDLAYFRPGDIAFVSSMEALDIGTGQEIFVLGFPMGISGIERNYVIARAGIIARFDDEILARSRSYLIDAAVFPGNSGGPVIVKPRSDTLSDRRPVDRAYVIGLVRSYLPYEEVVYSLQTETPSPRMVFTENSGLAEVIPMDCVKEAADAVSSGRPAAAPPTRSAGGI